MDCRTRIVSNDYADMIVDFDLSQEVLNGTAGDFCYYQIEDNLRIFYANREELPPLFRSEYRYLYLPVCYGLMQTGNVVPGGSFNTLALEETGSLRMQRPPLSLTGLGCIFACIDTGIDYQNEVFRREDGSSRIMAIWDQENQTGIPPEGFLYGSEYTREQINEALASENPREKVPTGDIPGRHGTALASIAAGSSIAKGTAFLGAAPDADIVVVKLKQAKPYLKEYYLIPEETPCYAETDILTALKYVLGYAKTFEAPVCICLGLGTSIGDHSGNSLLERYINKLNTLRNVAVVLPAGNEGNAGHHFRTVFDRNEGNVVKNAEIRVGEGNRGFIAEIWGNVSNFFAVSLRSPGGEEIRDISFRIFTTRVYRFVYSDTVVTIDTLLVEQISGQQLVVMKFENPTPGIWTIGLRSEDNKVAATYDIWLPIQQFLTGTTYFLEPTPYVTLTAPATGQAAMCVSAYNRETGGFFQESGRGYTRAGAIKPDFAAPGVNVPSIIGAISGTGAAAALTAGAVLQFMQWAVIEKNAPLANGVEMKSFLIRGARRDDFLVWPNRELGYGKLDLYGTYEQLREL